MSTSTAPLWRHSYGELVDSSPFRSYSAVRFNYLLYQADCSARARFSIPGVVCRDEALTGLARIAQVVNCAFLLVHASVRCSEYLYLMREKRSIVGLDDGMEFTNLKASMSRVKIDTTDQVCAMGRVFLSDPPCVLFFRRGWGHVLLLNHRRPLELVGTVTRLVLARSQAPGARSSACGGHSRETLAGSASLSAEKSEYFLSAAASPRAVHGEIH